MLSIVVALASLGVFTWLSTAFNKISEVIEATDKIEALEKRLENDHLQYSKIINEYKSKIRQDSLHHVQIEKKISSIRRTLTNDSVKIDYNRQWVLYWQQD